MMVGSLPEHLVQLALDFTLYNVLNSGYRAERAVDVGILKRCLND
jgi:hypothetical protein